MITENIRYVIIRIHFDNKDAFPEVPNTFFCDGFKCKVLHIMKRKKMFECDSACNSKIFQVLILKKS